MAMDNQEQDEFELEVDDGVDLYDDMITASGGAQESEHLDDTLSSSPDPVNSTGGTTPLNNGKSGDSHRERATGQRDSIVPLRKFQAYIGNLTWWTSDQDIQDAVTEAGINDFIEVKFYENRANGQSKGYTVLTVGSESSLKIVHDKLPKKELHGQFPVVTPPTKQALNQFEAQAKTRPSGTSNEKGPPNGEMNNMGGMGGGPPMGMGQRGMMGPGPRGPRGMHPPPGMGPPPGHRNMGPNMGPGGYGPPRPMMPPNMGGPMQGPPRGPMPIMNEPFYPHGPPHMGHRGPGPGGPGSPGGMPPREGWPRSPMNFPHGPNGPHGHGPHGPGPGPHLNAPNGSPMQGHMRGPMPPHPMSGSPPQQPPAPHMNPAFFHQQAGPNAGTPMPGGPGPMGGPASGPYNSPNPQSPYPNPTPLLDIRDAPVTPQIPEVEFEDIMSRNRTVSSSAISRAVSDAAAGEFASAIETLVTAISLISQSKVAHDDRCKILVSSLRDTLHGIEAKSYGRGRDYPAITERRSHSRDRDRHRSRRRERSRSREYRDRSRERDRYYEYPRERSRSREYRADRPREEGARPYYDERYRERERTGSEREREPRSSRSEQERPREREPEREREREVVVHRTRH